MQDSTHTHTHTPECNLYHFGISALSNPHEPDFGEWTTNRNKTFMNYEKCRRLTLNATDEGWFEMSPTKKVMCRRIAAKHIDLESLNEKQTPTEQICCLNVSIIYFQENSFLFNWLFKLLRSHSPRCSPLLSSSVFFSSSVQTQTDYRLCGKQNYVISISQWMGLFSAVSNTAIPVAVRKQREIISSICWSWIIFQIEIKYEIFIVLLYYPFSNLVCVFFFIPPKLGDQFCFLFSGSLEWNCLNIWQWLCLFLVYALNVMY